MELTRVDDEEYIDWLDEMEVDVEAWGVGLTTSLFSIQKKKEKSNIS
jgi:hypothetical protein